jgi:3-hydroxy-9,10-secoandrosta-1,3,5(10)-triene-9,17-dione monooxygenase reductase component
VSDPSEHAPDPSELTRPFSENFRTVLGRLPTGVVVVTGGDPENPSALVVGSFMSVSLEPPLVAVSPAKSSTSWPAIEASGHFCANVLGEGQEDLARRFAKSGGEKFAGVNWAPSPATGSPLLEGVAAWIDCRTYERYEAGDHWLVLGEVLELSGLRESGALVFHSGVIRPLN